MKKLLFIITMLITSLSLQAQFVRVDGTQLIRNGEPYYFAGTNFWYGPILGSEGFGGDRQRLIHELDAMQAQGIDNLRILAGADAGSINANSVKPVLQSAPGVLNDTLLAGLDFLLSEMAKRQMVAVVYLTNSWDWSGGFGYYLKQVGEGDSPNANGDGYGNYIRYATKFFSNQKAQNLFANYVHSILTRTNRYTGKKYVDDPTIMAWQLCNEPRAFSQQAKPAFAKWIHASAALIKSLDSNHLVTLGSEGIMGCELDPDLCEQIHADSLVDYMTVHIWPYNWQWCGRTTLYEDLPIVYTKTQEYIEANERIAERINKPFVIEEFGYPRDRFMFTPNAGVNCRDGFYGYILSQVLQSERRHKSLAGCNFWGWGGEAIPLHEIWAPGDPYLCDPPHEPQGWYSVYASDTSTLSLIRNANKELRHNQ